MPVAGRKPKPQGQARNRAKPVHEWVEVQDAPYQGDHPELPKKRTIMTPFGPKDVPLRAMTRQWWKSTCSMPHCALWAESDWMFALTTAMVADSAFSGGIGAATELRNREKTLGTTGDARLGLRIRYVRMDEVEVPSEVTNLDDYRAI